MQENKSEKKQFEPELMNLDGKIAIISGGTTGIGRATALLLAKKGVKVVIYGRHQDALDDALADLEQTGGEFHGLTADNSKPDDVTRVFAETRDKFGDVDILINNAAVAATSVLDTPYDEMVYVIQSNLVGYLQCAREAIESMRRKGAGHIVNVGSMSAQVREGGSDIYVATKAAIEAASEALRKQLAEENIRISLIEPGLVGTDLAGDSPNVGRQLQDQAEGRSLEAEDIAQAIYYTLTQPPRTNVLELRVAPIRQAL